MYGGFECNGELNSALEVSQNHSGFSVLRSIGWNYPVVSVRKIWINIGRLFGQKVSVISINKTFLEKIDLESLVRGFRDQ